METLFQISLAIFWICALVFIIGIVQLIRSKGKSKSALRMVIVPLIVVGTLITIGFGTCVFAVLNN